MLIFLILVISLMRTLTFLMGREISLRIFLLCLFFISEILFIQFLDTKIPNNGENQVNISKIKISITYILINVLLCIELSCREV